MTEGSDHEATSPLGPGCLGFPGVSVAGGQAWSWEGA